MFTLDDIKLIVKNNLDSFYGYSKALQDAGIIINPSQVLDMAGILRSVIECEVFVSAASLNDIQRFFCDNQDNSDVIKEYESLLLSLLCSNIHLINELDFLVPEDKMSETFISELQKLLTGKRIKINILNAKNHHLPSVVMDYVTNDTSSGFYYDFAVRNKNHSGVDVSYSYVISKNGRLMLPDSFSWDNPNHRFKGYTEQNADGVRIWTEIPISAITLTMTKQNQQHPCEYDIIFKPKHLTIKQIKKIKEIQALLIEKYPKWDIHKTWTEQL